MLSLRDLCSDNTERIDVDADAVLDSDQTTITSKQPKSTKRSAGDTEQESDKQPSQQPKANKRFTLEERWKIVQELKRRKCSQLALANEYGTIQVNISRWNTALGKYKTLEEVKAARRSGSYKRSTMKRSRGRPRLSNLNYSSFESYAMPIAYANHIYPIPGETLIPEAEVQAEYGTAVGGQLRSDGSDLGYILPPLEFTPNDSMMSRNIGGRGSSR